MSTPRRLRPTTLAALAGAQPTPTRRRRACGMAAGALALLLAIPALASAGTGNATFTYTPAAPVTGQAVSFNAAGSACGTVKPCTYRWTDDGADGPAGTQWSLGTGATLSFTFKVAGTKNVRLQAFDGNGTLQAQLMKSINVTTAPTTPPPTTPPPTTPPPTTPPPTTPPPTTPSTCNRNATTSTFASEVSAATAGQVICLAAGNYGTWTGTNKAIFVRPASGAAVTMGFNFTTGDSGFTVDGVTTPGGNITNGAKSITIKNSKFTGHMILDGLANSNVVLDHNTHDGITTCSSCDPAMVHLAYGSSTPSGVTISNSLFANGNADGIQTGVGVNIINNEFRNIKENGPSDTAHTDAIQLLGASGSVVRGNYIHHSADGIVAYDGISNALIENNVIDLVNGRWGIELYSDNGSTIRHNTLVYNTGCAYAPCGLIVLDHKSSDPAGKGTIVQDNVATEVSLNNGSTVAKRDHNMVRRNVGSGDVLGTPSYTGGSAPTTWTGFHLASSSPGAKSSTAGTAVGIQ